MARPLPVAIVVVVLLFSLSLAPLASAEIERYRLQRGESIAAAVGRRYGDKHILLVLELHARRPLRGSVVSLPTLRQVLSAEGATALAPDAVETLLRSRERFVLALRRSWPVCDVERRWTTEERQLLDQAAAELAHAIRLVKALQPQPRSMIKHLGGAEFYLRQQGANRGGIGCKPLLGAHKRFAYALTAAIEWARRGKR
jgi:hypothetical protein